ncbi:ADP-ribosylation factor-like protein 6 [Tritrichomonas foetus]|uniref:ADP-ribosylation factor-like protein 6 n=1 Tax=Tritrichomonas foetus TaxID=1144522 RepID=A0A1J4KCD9_9EUKA|nr:ADP-ribosylation factor-like protein 6 [Tritrichomonas foetus]|eukprot:OHT07310.1 ADP-ribosylation factor-like protein 6 [Tritrichomonas foetus]
MGCGNSVEQSQSFTRTVTFVGLDGAGKSSIVRHIVNSEQSSSTNDEFIPIPTAAVDFYEISLSASKFRIYDCGGLGRYRDQWPFYIKQADAVAFVIDRTDKNRMSVVREEIKGVLNQCQQQNIPILIFINKSDKKSSLNDTDFKMITKINEFKVEYMLKDCIGKSGEGIIAGRDWLLQHIKPRATVITAPTAQVSP